MKDKIKELEPLLGMFEMLKDAKGGSIELSKRESDLLLDCITNLRERCEYLERSNNRREDEIMSLRDECVDGETYKARNEKANALLDEMLERAYIDGEYIMYDYSTSELLEVKQALQGEDKQ